MCEECGQEKSVIYSMKNEIQGTLDTSNQHSQKRKILWKCMAR